MAMRLMIWHLDYMKAVPTEKGRSEEVAPPKAIDEKNPILVFVSFEKADEAREGIADRGAAEIASVAKGLGASNIVLNPFAHMFAELSSPRFAIEGMSHLENLLAPMGFKVASMSFGYFYEIEMKAKGHRYSRQSKVIT